jgi:hypothetical protein
VARPLPHCARPDPPPVGRRLFLSLSPPSPVAAVRARATVMQKGTRPRATLSLFMELAMMHYHYSARPAFSRGRRTPRSNHCPRHCHLPAPPSSCAHSACRVHRRRRISRPTLCNPHAPAHARVRECASVVKTVCVPGILLTVCRRCQRVVTELWRRRRQALFSPQSTPTDQE